MFPWIAFMFHKHIFFAAKKYQEHFCIISLGMGGGPVTRESSSKYYEPGVTSTSRRCSACIKWPVEGLTQLPTSKRNAPKTMQRPCSLYVSISFMHQSALKVMNSRFSNSQFTTVQNLDFTCQTTDIKWICILLSYYVISNWLCFVMFLVLELWGHNEKYQQSVWCP